MADTADDDRTPSLARRITFWLFLGLVSTAAAELLFPTTPFALGTLVLVAVPIYTLHVVVLAGIVFALDRVNFATLYLSGVVLGLYEAYITKVVWAPLGDPLGPLAGGIYWAETLSLVLFWHPFVAFLLPVLVVERVATASRQSLGPPLVGSRYTPHLAAVAIVWLALFQGTLGQGPVVTALANVAALGGLLVALLAWRRRGGHQFEMATLLPGRRALAALGTALLALYAVLGVTVRPEMVPRRPVPHLLVVAGYLATGGALALVLRRDGPLWPEATPTVSLSKRRALLALGAFVFVSGAAGLLARPLAVVVFLSYFVLGTLVGVGSLVYIGWRTAGSA